MVSNLVYRFVDILFIVDEYLECGIYVFFCFYN